VFISPLPQVGTLNGTRTLWKGSRRADTIKEVPIDNSEVVSDKRRFWWSG
jgi:hypothetical protein